MEGSDKKNVQSAVSNCFEKEFGKEEVTKFAPGRANIIGEHTDYNDGLVLPFAIEQGIFFYASRNGQQTFHIIAHDTLEQTSFTLKNDQPEKYGWEKFFRQVLQVMPENQISGINLVFGGNLPLGAGISSSSAITCGFISIINDLFSLGMTTTEMVLKASEAEIGYGVRGGIMDQFTIFNGKKNKAILLDCRDSTYEYIDLDMPTSHFFLINTNIKHNLLHTEYNNRRAECELAVTSIRHHLPSIHSLRDVKYNNLPEIREFLDDTMFNRVSFIVQENRRVLLAANAIKLKDWALLGSLLYESHDGLSNMYEVSCAELDWLVNYTLNIDEISGARMMGGGFGGCTINLITEKLDANWEQKMSRSYLKEFGLLPSIIRLTANNGLMFQ